MSRIESDLRDHAISLLHQDYLEVEKKINGLSDKISIELDLISQSARQVPHSINQSLEHIASALEDAEKTASNLSQEARLAIMAVKDSEIDAIRREVLIGLNSEMAKAQEVAENIRKTLLSYPDAFRPKAPVKLLVGLSALVVAAVIGCFFILGKSINNLHQIDQFLTVYEQQQKVIQTLPAEYRKKF